MVKKMFPRVLFLVAIFIASSNIVHASTLCPPVESSGEGHWPIPEGVFTLENAEKALKDLELLLEQQSLKRDDFFSKYHNASVMIEGYLQKKHIAELKAANSKQEERFTKLFCKFLEEKAYVSH